VNILVTGGTGYIGSHTALVLSEAGHNVVLFDNLRQSNPQVASRLEALCDKPMPLVMGDVRDTTLLSCTLLHHEVNAVVHCAGFKGLSASIVRPLESYANNVQGMLSLLQAMSVSEAPTLVFCSSSAVYGESFAVLQDEHHPTVPTSPLGRSLLQAETVLTDVIAADSSLWRAAILRCFSPSGAHESGLVSDSSGLPHIAEGFMSELGRVAAGDAPFFPLHIQHGDSPDGTAVRDFTHVMDIAHGHLAALNFLVKNPGLHTFNLGSGKPRTLREAVSAYQAVSGQRIASRPVEWSPEEVSRCAANVQRARDLLGWEAGHSLTSICESSWNHLLTQKMVNAAETRGVRN
jgi:UDP-glucose 4-epimerase